MTFSSLFGINEMSFKQRFLGILFHVEIILFFGSSNFLVYLFDLSFYDTPQVFQGAEIRGLGWPIHHIYKFFLKKLKKLKVKSFC